MSQLAVQKRDRVHIGAYVDRRYADELARLARESDRSVRPSCHYREQRQRNRETRKPPPTRGFSSSGRRDLNSGPRVPQTPQAVCRRGAAGGVTWLPDCVCGPSRYRDAAPLRVPVSGRSAV